MDRKIKKKEYARVLAYMEAVGLNGYRQELGSADGAFIPAVRRHGDFNPKDKRAARGGRADAKE